MGSFPADSWCSRNDAARFVTRQAEWLCGANHGSIGDFSPIAFSGCPRGHSVYRETWCSMSTRSLTGLRILTLEPERLEDQPAIAGNESGKGLYRRSSCLLFSMLGVETNSFLPNQQSAGHDLARQREARRRRLHASGNASLVEILKGTCGDAAKVAAPLKTLFLTRHQKFRASRMLETCWRSN